MRPMGAKDSAVPAVDRCVRGGRCVLAGGWNRGDQCTDERVHDECRMRRESRGNMRTRQVRESQGARVRARGDVALYGALRTQYDFPFRQW